MCGWMRSGKRAGNRRDAQLIFLVSCAPTPAGLLELPQSQEQKEGLIVMMISLHRNPPLPLFLSLLCLILLLIMSFFHSSPLSFLPSPLSFIHSLFPSLFHPVNLASILPSFQLLSLNFFHSLFLLILLPCINPPRC